MSSNVSNARLVSERTLMVVFCGDNIVNLRVVIVTADAIFALCLETFIMFDFAALKLLLINVD